MNDTPKERPADKFTDAHVNALIKFLVEREFWQKVVAKVKAAGLWIAGAVALVATFKEQLVSLLFGKGN